MPDSNSFMRLKKESDNIIKQGWVEYSTSNTGNIGLLFERLLGLTNHNFPIPDYEEIEIKTKIKNTIPKISLFNATPDSCIYPIQRLHAMYGYPDHNNPNFKVFQLSFYVNRITYVNENIYAKLYIDKKSEQVILNFYDKNDILIDCDIAWSFTMLKEKLNIKLKYLFLMYAERKKLKNKCYCRYTHYQFFSYKGFDSFLSALEKGYMRINFTIGIFKSGKRCGQIHDHGTSFDLDTHYIREMFTRLNI